MVINVSSALSAASGFNDVRTFLAIFGVIIAVISIRAFFRSLNQ